MTLEQKKTAICVATMIGRCLMAIACAAWVCKCTTIVLYSATLLGRIGIAAMGLCTVWALGHAVDCYWDHATQTLLEAVKFREACKQGLKEEETE